MSSRQTNSITRTATRWALGLLSLLAVLPPLLWVAVGGLIEHAQAHAAAHTVSWLLDAESAPSGAPSPARAGLLPALGLPEEGSRVSWVLRRDGAPERTAHVGQAPDEPSFGVAVALAGGTQGQGEVRVERSLRGLLLQGLWVALASCALALAAWRLGMHRTVALVGRAESQFRSQASLDPLTGLLNREGLRRRLARALSRRRSNGAAVGVLLIDLDRFGLINETLGQALGDALLRSVADRIRAVTRSGDGLARLGGDQFAVHVDTHTGLQALTAMARNLHRAFAAPHALEGRELMASFSIGIALSEGEEGSVDALLHQATQAVRMAKKQGGNRVCVHEAEPGEDEGVNRMDLEQRLYGALGAGQFFVLYQPIVDAVTEQVDTVEALIRWRDPQRGVVSPVEFIPALEQTGLIVPVGRWVLREACAQAARWPGGKPIKVSVNLSPLQFAEADLLQMIAAVLRETGLPGRRLQLEVTEGLLLDPTPQTLQKIEGLAQLGVSLAVDDFGMGYSSLIYLKRFRLHTLKIDRMFVRDIVEQPQDMTIVRAIIDLGHGLGMRVTAEGVETRAQADALRALGCDTLQGYLFSRPATVEALGNAAGGSAPASRPAAMRPAAVAQEPQPA